MQVTGCGLQVAMAEEQLNSAQIGARVEQVGGKGVAQHMRAERLDHAQLAAQFLAEVANPGGIHRLVRYPSGKEPVLGFAPTPVDTEQLQQLGREHDLAREVSLACTDVDDHAL